MRESRKVGDCGQEFEVVISVDSPNRCPVLEIADHRDSAFDSKLNDEDYKADAPTREELHAIAIATVGENGRDDTSAEDILRKEVYDSQCVCQVASQLGLQVNSVYSKRESFQIVFRCYGWEKVVESVDALDDGNRTVALQRAERVGSERTGQESLDESEKRLIAVAKRMEYFEDETVSAADVADRAGVSTTELSKTITTVQEKLITDLAIH